MSAAGELKQKGNEQFKAGQFAKASELYAKAEEADPTDPVYPSNLSAALYETGDYSGCVYAILRSWNLLDAQRDLKRDLVVRLSSRLAKALSFAVTSSTNTQDALTSHVAEIEELKKYSLAFDPNETPSFAITDLRRAWDDWDALESNLTARKQSGDACRTAFSRLPLFIKPLVDVKEYYTIGHDPIIDLTFGWGSENENGNDLLAFEKHPSEKLSRVAFLFGGVGDGRHALGTIVGIHEAYNELSAQKKSVFHSHLTLLDIHPTAIARDLCFLTLLHDLGCTEEPVARAEIQVTLMYAFCGAVMPGYCYHRLMSVVKTLTEQLSTTPPALPSWLYVETNTIPQVLDALDYWAKTQKDTRKMLANHSYISPRMQWNQRAQAMCNGSGAGDFRRQLRESLPKQRREMEDTLRRLSDEHLLQMPWMPPGLTAHEGRALLESNMEMIVNTMQRTTTRGKVPTVEQDWYKFAMVFYPPAELRSRHPGFEQAWSQLENGDDVDRAAARKIYAHIETEWKPNITLFASDYDDPKFHPGGDDYKPMSCDVFEPIRHIDDFNENYGEVPKGHLENDVDLLASDIFGAFCDKVSTALKGLDGRITVELIAGGLPEELSKMRLNQDVTRPAEFPRTYTRMWLSNVPDYTHGPMNMALYIVPNLQDDEQAGASCNCLLNRCTWANDSQYFYTYAQLLPEDVPRYLGCRVICPRAVRDVLVLRPLPLPRPFSELASRDELTSWLTRVLFNALIPGHTRPSPENVRLPNNLVAFVGLLMHLHRVGYPAHWLSDFLARVLSGSMVSDTAPYAGVWPIPLEDMHRRVPSRRVRTDPWLVEFESILATAYYALPFPVANILPADFSCEPEDIVLWEAQVTTPVPFTTSRYLFMGGVSPYEPVTRLLFYKPDAGAPGALIGGMRRVFEGAASPPPGTFFVLTAQELVQYDERIRFRLSKHRVERMRAEKWCMVAYRQDTGQQATHPAPAVQWISVSEDDVA